MKDVPFVQGSRPMISNVSVLHWIAIYRLINTLTWCVKARHTISVLYVISEPVLITFDMAKTVAHAIVGSKLDYCNSLLAGMTLTKLNKEFRKVWPGLSPENSRAEGATLASYRTSYRLQT